MSDHLPHISPYYVAEFIVERLDFIRPWLKRSLALFMQQRSPSLRVYTLPFRFLSSSLIDNLSDLNLVREILIQRLGHDFAQSALHNSDGHVSHRVRSSTGLKPNCQLTVFRFQ